MQYAIRQFRKEDREPLRRISCETAFLEIPRRIIFTDDEVLADALTLYFTDYEPGSCFVAQSCGKVVGYIIGSKDVRTMGAVFNTKIFPSLLAKAWRKKIFFHKTNLRFLFLILRSAARREFSMPDFSREFPAALHINLADNFRGQGLGRALVEHYLDYLKQNKISGVHFGTISDKARGFFTKAGFRELFKNRRTYLQPYTGRESTFYIFGMKL